jgi:hypothetical protein
MLHWVVAQRDCGTLGTSHTGGPICTHMTSSPSSGTIVGNSDVCVDPDVDA